MVKRDGSVMQLSLTLYVCGHVMNPMEVGFNASCVDRDRKDL